jgi:chlorosome envelope protein X
MNIKINDRECSANTGDRLLDVARANHSHIGYFCGGNALCQTCYVKVLEGQELLSPMTNAEKAMLSDELISEGTRMACQANIDKPGKITILTTVEEVKRMTLSNPVEIPAYMAKMGREAAVKFTDTIAFQARRDSEGHQVSLWQLFADVIGGISDAIQLVIEAVQSAFTPVVAVAATEPVKTGNGQATPGLTPKPAASNPDCGTARVSPEVLHRHRESKVACN